MIDSLHKINMILEKTAVVVFTVISVFLTGFLVYLAARFSGDAGTDATVAGVIGLLLLVSLFFSLGLSSMHKHRGKFYKLLYHINFPISILTGLLIVVIIGLILIPRIF